MTMERRVPSLGGGGGSVLPQTVKRRTELVQQLIHGVVVRC